jgi:hypothetical protein
MGNIKYYLIFTIILFNNLFAEDSKKPFRQIDLGSEHRIITTGAKLTSGIVQTAGGLLHLVWFPITYGSFISNKVNATESNPKGKTYNLKLVTRGEQLNIVFNQWNGFYPRPYSLGLFQNNQITNFNIPMGKNNKRQKDILNHEISHSIAHDALGPMIIPLYILDYFGAGHDSSVIEYWAKREQTFKVTATRIYQPGILLSNHGPGFTFKISDEQTDDWMSKMNGARAIQRKLFNFFDTKIILGEQPSDDCNCDQNGGLSGSFDLSTYAISYSLQAGMLGLRAKGQHLLGHVEITPTKDVIADLIRSANSVGLEINISDNIKLYASGGVSGSISGAGKNLSVSPDILVGLNGSYGAIFGNIFDLRRSHESLWGAKGTRIKRNSFSLLPLANEKNTSPITFGVQYRDEKIKIPSQERIKINQFLMFLGGRL